MIRYALPLILFAGLVVLLWSGLGRDPQKLPSALLHQPAPAFTLSRLDNPQETFSPDDMLGKVWLFNVWASWCVACLEEHPVISSLAGDVDIIGLNYKDKKPDAKAWLNKWRNPYLMSVVDPNGDVGIEYGVYGVPETFLIDRMGYIRYKHVGPISHLDADNILRPLIRQLEGSDG